MKGWGEPGEGGEAGRRVGALGDESQASALGGRLARGWGERKGGGGGWSAAAWGLGADG